MAENSKREQRLEVLKDMQTNLFNEVFSPSSSDFHDKMETKDEDYIEGLCGRIEKYVDNLAIEFGINNICLVDNKNYNTKILPGHTYFNNAKTFIHQLYSILGDYNFFHIYLKFPEMADNVSLVNSDGVEEGMYYFVIVKWNYNLNIILEGMDTPEEKRTFLTMIIFRLKRIQFMRSFDKLICNDGEYLRYNRLKEFFAGMYLILKDALDNI